MILPDIVRRAVLATCFRLCRRTPDFVIGPDSDPYLLRWFVIPRNPWFNIYFHRFARSDDDRSFHDHPWKSLSILLEGDYIEVRPQFQADPQGPIVRVHYSQGSVIYRNSALYAHRIQLHEEYFFSGPNHQHAREKAVWTLFITGRKTRKWGFWCKRGWIPWTEFAEVKPGGNERGAGCGEE